MKLRTYLLRSQLPLWTVLALFGGTELWSTRANLQASHLANHAQTEISQTRALMKTVVDLETGVRGYVITGVPEFLEPYDQARLRFRSQLEDLQSFEVTLNDVDTPGHLRQLQTISGLLDTWLRDVASYDISQQGDHPELVIDREKSGLGKQLIDQIRAETDRFEKGETGELMILQKRAARASKINQVVTFTGVLIAILVSVLSSLIVARSLGGKFGRLADAAEALATTEHAEAVTGFHLEEAARLADSFNRMAGKLQASHGRVTEHNRLLNLRNVEVTATNELAEQLQTCFTLQEGYLVLQTALPQLFHGTAGRLAIMNASKNLMEVHVRWGTAEGTDDGVVFEPSACWAIRTGRMYDPAQKSLAAPCLVQGAAGGHLCLPLLAHGEVIGTLRLTELQGDAVEAARLRDVAVTIANQVGMGLSNLKLRETLRNQSIRDPLTGLFNRRYLDETFEREIRRAERRQTPLTVMMLDVDHFKRFNDEHGHDAGDAVLTSLGRLLQEHFRREDIVCRYGGEEFAVLMSDASLADGMVRAEALRAAASELKLDFQGRNLGRLTLSIGVTAYPDQGSDPAQLIRHADQALYRAKQQGRDRVISAVTPVRA